MVGRGAVVAQVDPQGGVGVDAVPEDLVADRLRRGQVVIDHDALAVAGDQVALARAGPADLVPRRRDIDPVARVPQDGIPRGVGADVVPDHLGERRLLEDQVHPGAAVAGDEVALHRGFRGIIDEDPVESVADGGHARGVGADEVPRDEVVHARQDVDAVVGVPRDHVAAPGVVPPTTLPDSR